MASMTMTASFLGGSAAAISKIPTTTCRGVAMIKASKVSHEGDQHIAAVMNKKEDHQSNNGRRELVFAAAAAAACSLARIAMAEVDEPKRGTPEAKKKYAPICVTNPTARVCRN